MNTIITRRKMFDEKKFYITTNSTKSDYDGKWSNCLYLHFAKEDFPQIKSPQIIDVDWSWKKRHFEYHESILNKLSWHGGITFYEEVTDVESGRTHVKVGCDYQHLHDDEYQREDNGEIILETDGKTIAHEFDALIKALNEKGEGE